MGELTDDTEIRHLLQSSRERKDPKNNGSHHAPHNRTCGMSRDDVHSNGESQNMTSHNKDEEDGLGCSSNLAAPGAKKNLSYIT